MRFRQFTMHNAQFTMERWGCRGELCSPAIDFVILNIVKNLFYVIAKNQFSVILNAVKNLRALMEVGGVCE